MGVNPRRLLLRGAMLGAALLVLVLGLRVWDTLRGPPLEPWHTFVPPELSVAALDGADWSSWMQAEARVFDAVRTQVSATLDAAQRVPANRYFPGSPLHPAGFAQDWNRSFVLEPDGPPRGAAVLLHGMTDAPFSLRHVAQRYRALGFIAIGLRLPAHGTVPAGLTEVTWEQWAAATRLAMREARRRAGPDAPVHLVGYSNGGALALQHALAALEDPRLPRAERVVLLSPMIGVTAFARFAGLAALPAMLPAFAKTAWLGIEPEFNPFKYNSFPANAARQSWRLTSALQDQIARLDASGRLAALPPVLTFQSVADFTVSTPALLTALYARLPANGSEVVLFDLNRNAKLGPLITPAASTMLDRMLPPAPRRYRTTIIANADADSADAAERRTEAGATTEQARPIGLSWPRDVHSLSHVALPFPVQDGLYGLEPDEADAFGVRLGALASRGERGLLLLGADSQLRLTSNPFFPYMITRIEDAIRTRAPRP